MTLFEKLKANPVTIDLKSRKVIFCFDQKAHEYKADEQFTFSCGIEMDDGCLDTDSDPFVTHNLGNLFPDLPINVEAAESFHTIPYTPDLTYKQMKEIVVTRLKRSGAIFVKE